MAHSSIHVEPHPEPPADLSKRELPLTYLTQRWFRVFRCALGPLYFNGSNAYRFNAPDAEYKVLYLGGDEYCAFIETLGHSTGSNTITMSELAQRCLCTVTSDRPLAVVDLTGSGLAQLSCDNRLSTTEDYKLAQRWAVALWNHDAQPDGIYYRSRHDPSLYSLALFERAKDVIHEDQRWVLADSANIDLLRDLLDKYKFSLINDTA